METEIPIWVSVGDGPQWMAGKITREGDYLACQLDQDELLKHVREEMWKVGQP